MHFSTASPVTLDVLINECSVSREWHPEGSDISQPETFAFDALWDTGATNSVISHSVVGACRLTAVGVVQIDHVDGSYMADVYVVNIILPNDVMFSGMRVTGGSVPGADILIGMDIISQGDFAISNQNGGTKFTFRIPSIEDIDFAAELSG